MKKSALLTLAVVVTLLTLGGVASAATINSIMVSGNQVTIGGDGFTGSLTITLDGQQLDIVSSTSTQIVATVSTLPSPGTYRLVVKAPKASTSAWVSLPSAPAVVATIALYNQTGNVPTTTLFTPVTNGLYRFTAYMAETVAGGTGGAWSLEVNWDDFRGQQGMPVELGCNQVDEAPVTSVSGEVQAGQPITYNVGGDNASGTYEVLLTVERLM